MPQPRRFVFASCSYLSILWGRAVPCGGPTARLRLGGPWARRRPWACPTLACLLFACQVALAETRTPVILISVDTLRADHLSCYQPGRRPTPNIDRLAKNGTLFSETSTPFPLTLSGPHRAVHVHLSIRQRSAR